VRFFQIANNEDYENARATLDAAWGHPSADTVTCVEPAETAPHDQQGRVLLAVQNEFAEYAPVNALLPQWIAAGVVAEINAEEYEASIVRRNALDS